MTTKYVRNTDPKLTIGSGIPTDAAYDFTPDDGQKYVDQVTETLYVRVNGAWQPYGPSGAANGITAGVLFETFSPSDAVVDQAAALTTQIITAVAVRLVAGRTYSAANWLIGATAAISPTNQWSGLATGVAAGSSLKVVAISADGLTTAIGAGGFMSHTFGAAYVAPTTGLYFAFVMVKATVPSLVCKTVSALVSDIAPVPVLVGPSSTGQTTPPALAASLTSVSAVGTKLPYMYLS